MRAKSLKNSQILRAHMPYFRGPGHKCSIHTNQLEYSYLLDTCASSENVIEAIVISEMFFFLAYC